MKKFLLLILSFAYLASSSGATLYIHQCMGKTIGWEINIESNSCGNCKEHKNFSHRCCKDEVKILKSTLDQNLPANFYAKIIPGDFIVPKAYYACFKSTFEKAKHDSSERFIFPPNKIDYSVLYCTFLI